MAQKPALRWDACVCMSQGCRVQTYSRRYVACEFKIYLQLSQRDSLGAFAGEFALLRSSVCLSWIFTIGVDAYTGTPRVTCGVWFVLQRDTSLKTLDDLFLLLIVIFIQTGGGSVRQHVTCLCSRVQRKRAVSFAVCGWGC